MTGIELRAQAAPNLGEFQGIVWIGLVLGVLKSTIFPRPIHAEVMYCDMELRLVCRAIATIPCGRFIV